MQQCQDFIRSYQSSFVPTYILNPNSLPSHLPPNPAGTQLRILHPPRYLFQPLRTNTLPPPSPSPKTNFSHRPSLPAPMTSNVQSSTHPTTPFLAFPPGIPGIGRLDPTPNKDVSVGSSSSISMCAEAKEYASEKTRGRRGILPNNPHFWLLLLFGLLGSVAEVVLEYGLEGRL